MAAAPDPPYVAVIFTNRRTEHDDVGYERAAVRMVELAGEQAGFLGIESVRDQDGIGITVSYWTDHDAVEAWRTHPEHLEAQAQGRSDWYQWYDVRIATVERAHALGNHD